MTFTALEFAFGGYFLLVFLIAWVAYRRTQDLSDYLLGGRRLGPGAAALSAGASDMSGWLLLGLPGFAYTAGLPAIWIAIGLLVGTWCNWRWVAQPLRDASEAAGNALTIPSYFANRYGDPKGWLRLISALLILIFFLIYTASGLVAGGKLFESVFGLDYHLAVLIGAAAIVIYTLIGGFLAVSWTDLFQGLLMLAALLLVPVVASLQWNITAGDSTFLMDRSGESLGAVALISSLAWGVGYFGQPHIMARFKAIRSSNEVPKARRIAVGWTALGLLGALSVGWAGVSLQDGVVADPETVFMVLVEALFSPALAGVLLAGILAAIMSTADSQLLVSASVLSEDLYRCRLRPSASAQELLWIGRLTVLCVALIAVAIALEPESAVLGLVAWAWAGFGSAFGPVMLLSLYWSGLNRAGVAAGMVAGGAVVLIWGSLEGGWFDLYEMVPGFCTSLIAAIAVSRLTSR